MTGAVLVGGTGLVGSHILATLLQHPHFSRVDNISRKVPPTSSIAAANPVAAAKLHPMTSPTTAGWPADLAQLTPPPDIMFSALGTTRAAAGSVAAQRLVDYDLNLSLATSARTAGAQVYVLISSAGANAKALFPYPKMKGELEDAVKKLGFKTVVILRPGVLLGDRSDSRPAEWALRKVAGAMGMLSQKASDFWAQDAQTVARAAVSAGIQALQGEKGGTWELGQSDIVRLGRTEWTS